MATLEKIRNKSVLLFVIIIVALLAFILGDFLTSGRTYFGHPTTVAKAGAATVEYQDYNNRLSQASEQLMSGEVKIAWKVTVTLKPSVLNASDFPEIKVTIAVVTLEDTLTAAVRAATPMNATLKDSDKVLLGEAIVGAIAEGEAADTFDVYLKADTLKTITPDDNLSPEFEVALIKWWNGDAGTVEDGIRTVTNSSKQPNATVVYNPNADVSSGEPLVETDSTQGGRAKYTYRSILTDLFLDHASRNLQNATSGYMAGYTIDSTWYIVEIPVSSAKDNSFTDTTGDKTFNIHVVSADLWPTDGE